MSKLSGLHATQSGRCLWCGHTTWIAPGTSGDLKDRQATVEHLRPRALGGSNEEANLALACRRCNTRRGRWADELRPHSDVLALLSPLKAKTVLEAIEEGRQKRLSEIPKFLQEGYRHPDSEDLSI